MVEERLVEFLLAHVDPEALLLEVGEHDAADPSEDESFSVGDLVADFLGFVGFKMLDRELDKRTIVLLADSAEGAVLVKKPCEDDFFFGAKVSD